MSKKIIKKQNSDSDSDLDSNLYSDSGSTNNKYSFESLVNSDFIKPTGGSMQDKMNKEDMKKKLEGYKTLKNEQYKYLLTLPLFKTWIRYYNPTTKQFRVGGLLMKVDPELRFIMLVNIGLKKSWSVQLKNNIIFIPDPDKIQEIDTEDETQTENLIKENNTKRQEYIIKDKLYKMYLEGKLKKSTQEEPIVDPEKIKECATKEKLFKLYTNGKLKRI